MVSGWSARGHDDEGEVISQNFLGVPRVTDLSR